MPRRKGQPAPDHVKRARETGWKIRQRGLALAKAEPGKSDQELIQEAIDQGRVEKLPEGIAQGALIWRAHDKF